MDIQESKSDGRGHDSRDGDQGSPESDGRPFCRPDQVSECDPEPSISNRTHTEGISIIHASFYHLSSQVFDEKNGVFSPFRRVFFRINLWMRILDLIFVGLPMHFVEDIF